MGVQTEIANFEPTFKEKLHSLSTSIGPAIEDLKALGPEGAAVAAIADGALLIVDAFDTMANGTGGAVEKLKAAGVHGFLNKPLHLEDLRKELKKFGLLAAEELAAAAPSRSMASGARSSARCDSARRRAGTPCKRGSKRRSARRSCNDRISACARASRSVATSSCAPASASPSWRPCSTTCATRSERRWATCGPRRWPP